MGASMHLHLCAGMCELCGMWRPMPIACTMCPTCIPERHTTRQRHVSRREKPVGQPAKATCRTSETLPELYVFQHHAVKPRHNCCVSTRVDDVDVFAGIVRLAGVAAVVIQLPPDNVRGVHAHLLPEKAKPTGVATCCRPRTRESECTRAVCNICVGSHKVATMHCR